MYTLPFNMMGRKLKVALIGLGGTGSFLSRELIQLDTALCMLDHESGLDVTYFDGSQVTEANISRQAFFANQVGENKAEASVWTANNLYAKSWTAHPFHLSKINTLNSFDIVITALDRPSVRYDISKASGSFLWLDCGNNEVAGQIVLGQQGGKNKAIPTICDLYDYSSLSDEDAEIKSCSAQESLRKQELGVNAFAARIAGQLLWNLLRNGKIESNGAYFDVRQLEVNPITEDDWAICGWTPPQS